MPPWSAIADDVAQSTGAPFNIAVKQSVGGGSINQAWRIEGSGQRYFVKLNHADRLQMFVAEAEGLREMASVDSLRIPAVVCYGSRGDNAWLVMEYLSLGHASGPALARLGTGLAVMHARVQPRFGWHRDNTIGSTPQPNARNDDWIEFLREQRLGFQLELAARNGYGGALQQDGERLLDRLDAFFSDYLPAPSLLHGDLWSGNFAVTDAGEPCVFDPAVYYGDREADMAMTELFGGFGADFYAAYSDVQRLDAGYGVRKTLYNLYHILNHLNIFGGGYLSQAQDMTTRLLAEVV